MKKAISIFISIILLATTILSGSLSAFAENTTKYWEPRPNCQDTIACVNDKEYSDDIKISYNNDSEQFTISYNGKGVVINWEFPLSEENKDYKIVSQSNNTIYIKLINKNQELPYINALVDFGETTTLKNKTKSGEQTSKQSKENRINESSTTKEKTSETTIPTTQKTNTTIQNHTNTPINNIQPDSNNQNTNKIIISCIIGVCILIIIFIIAKKIKH